MVAIKLQLPESLGVCQDPPAKMESRSVTRRTGGVRTGGRSARVVDAVFSATRTELGRVGYVALRIDDVATLSGVNKTTIYRRWPTKHELVADAIRADEHTIEVPDTGDVRADLRRMLLDDLDLLVQKERLGMLRIFYAERTNPEVDALGRELRTEHRRPRIERIVRAIERGELAAHVDPELVIDVLVGTVYGKVVRLGDVISHDYVASLVDLVLDGALAAPGSRRGA